MADDTRVEINQEKDDPKICPLMSYRGNPSHNRYGPILRVCAEAKCQLWVHPMGYGEGRCAFSMIAWLFATAPPGELRMG